MTDIERKVYRIVWSIKRTKQRNTSYEELERFTGRQDAKLNEVLISLVEKKIIWWDESRTKEVQLRADHQSPYTDNPYLKQT